MCDSVRQKLGHTIVYIFQRKLTYFLTSCLDVWVQKSKNFKLLTLSIILNWKKKPESTLILALFDKLSLNVSIFKISRHVARFENLGGMSSKSGGQNLGGIRPPAPPLSNMPEMQWVSVSILSFGQTACLLGPKSLTGYSTASGTLPFPSKFSIKISCGLCY